MWVTECKDIKIYADILNAYLSLILCNACFFFSYIDIDRNFYIKQSK